MRLLFSILVTLLVFADLWGQDDTAITRNDTLAGKYYLIPEVKRDGVTLPEIEIKEVTVHATHPPGIKKSDYRKYERLVYNLKKVYPYALMVRKKLNQVDAELKNISGDKDRKKYLKSIEKDVFAEYEDDIQNMTITQGKLLIKLIDRETQNTSFELIRDYRGKFSATFWQGVARIFGTNLKEEYDAFGEDSLIEAIINEIDAGRL